MHIQKKIALIFGITGQDGCYLTRFLLSKNYEVHGASRDAESHKLESLSLLGLREKVTLHSTALTDFRSVLQTLNKIEPDEIYNLSGQSSVGLSFQLPVETLESIATATLNLLEVVRFLEKPCRVYNASSSECFGDTKNEPADEFTAFRPRSPYAVAKSTAFWQVASYRESYNLFACSGILFNHESPLRANRFVTRKIATAVASIAKNGKGQLLLGDISIARDWGWAAEYVEAMWAMLQLPEPEDFVIATGKASTLKEFISIAFEAKGLNWEDHVTSDPSLYRPSELRCVHGDPGKAKAKLGWQARTKMCDIANRMVEAEVARLDGSKIDFG